MNFLRFKKFELFNGNKAMLFFKLLRLFLQGTTKAIQILRGFELSRFELMRASSLYLIRKNVSVDLCPSDQPAEKFKESVAELACNKKPFKTK